MNADFADSPFARHANLLLQHDHSAARHLALCVLSLYNGEDWPCRLDGIATFDTRYLQILLDMLVSYYRHGENDPHFLDLGRQLALRIKPTRRPRRRRRI